MAKKNEEPKKQRSYHSPILLLVAAVYLAYMAYMLWTTISDGSATGAGLIFSWIGCIAFIIIAVILVYLAVRFNTINKQALDEEIAQEQEELDNIVFEDADANEENTND